MVDHARAGGLATSVTVNNSAATAAPMLSVLQREDVRFVVVGAAAADVAVVVSEGTSGRPATNSRRPVCCRQQSAAGCA